MKVQAIFEFDLEDDDGEPIENVGHYRTAAEDAEHAIRMRLPGEGFLPADLLIGSWRVDVSVLDGNVSDADPPS